MNVVASSTTTVDRLLPPPTTAVSDHPTTVINFYNAVPQYELTLDEFELYALKRLRVSVVVVSPDTCDTPKPTSILTVTNSTRTHSAIVTSLAGFA